MDKETARTVYISWGVGLLTVVLALALRGRWWVAGTAVAGALLVLRGHFPGWFTLRRVLAGICFTAIAAVLLAGGWFLGRRQTATDASNVGAVPAQAVRPLPPPAAQPVSSTSDSTGERSSKQPKPRVKHTDLAKAEPAPAHAVTRTDSAPLSPPPGGSAAGGGNSGAVGVLNQGPCSVAQIGGSNNQAAGGNCSVLPHATITVGNTIASYASLNQIVNQREVVVSGAVIPKLTAEVHADSLIGIGLEPQPVGEWTTGPVLEGTTSTTVNNASGRLLLVVRFGKAGDRIRCRFICEGAECTVMQ